MATKRLKAMTRTLVDSVRKFLRQPTSDQSNEVPSSKEVAKAKSVAAGSRGGDTGKKGATGTASVGNRRGTSKRSRSKGRRRKG